MKTPIHLILNTLITARPQTTSTVSFVLFLVIAYTVLAINGLALIHDPRPSWINYLVVWLLSPISVFVTYKMISRYKVVRMGNGEIGIHYSLLRTHKLYTLKQVVYWTESTVKTGKASTYRELEIKFSDGRIIQMGHREFTEYEKMMSYLSQKLPKLRK